MENERELFTLLSENEFLSEKQKETLKLYAESLKKYREVSTNGPTIWPKYIPMEIESLEFDEIEGTVVLRARRIPNPDLPKIRMRDYWPK